MLALDIPDGHYEMHIPSNMENIPFKIERPHITSNSLHSLIGLSHTHREWNSYAPFEVQ